MKGVIRTKGGKNFSTMKVDEIESQPLEKNAVRVKMSASRINPVDMDLMKGFPSLKYKNPQVGGIDGSGEIIEVGSGVTNFQLGDQVYFYRLFTDIGTWATEIVLPDWYIAKIPDSLTLKEAGSIALPLLTAFEAIQSLRPQKGDSILIHGAGGGVGFMAVQIAKAMGMDVIANASERDSKALKSVGVQSIIDYKKEDFEEVLKGTPPTFVLDVIGNSTLLKSILLKPQKVVSIALPDPNSMDKSGVQLPWVFRKIMVLIRRKYVKAAKRAQVELIGHVTGANGRHLEEVARLFVGSKLNVRDLRTITLDDIANEGLRNTDLGKTLIF